MPAYWLARSRVIDPVEYKKYTDLVPDIIARHGGKILARGGKFRIMEGPENFHRFIVIEFPTFEQAVACFTSPEYDKAAAFRRNGAGDRERHRRGGGGFLNRRARRSGTPRGGDPGTHEHGSLGSAVFIGFGSRASALGRNDELGAGPRFGA